MKSTAVIWSQLAPALVHGCITPSLLYSPSRALASRRCLVSASTRPWSRPPSSPTLCCQFNYRRCCVPRCALAGVPSVVPLHPPLSLVPTPTIAGSVRRLPCSAFTASASSFVYGRASAPSRHPTLVLDKKPKRIVMPSSASNGNCGAHTSTSSFVSSPGLQLVFTPKIRED